MASAISHAVAAAALSYAALPDDERPSVRWGLAGLGMVSAVLPDLDVLAFSFGVPYKHMLGHRGLSHSIPIAILWSCVLLFAVTNRQHRTSKRRLLLSFILCTASHGILDAMTNGGLGVAFLAPFDGTRHFLPWRPIQVSPLSIRAFFTARGLDILASELVWVWLPAAVLAAGSSAVRHLVAARRTPWRSSNGDSRL